jgi:4-amino-4-deoxy-L-arabinose transferase-like glycosyltransferase
MNTRSLTDLGLVRFVRARPGLAVFLLALAVRLVVVAGLGPYVPPPAWGDDGTYDEIATRLLTRGEYVNSWYPPGYPLFLLAVYAPFGKSYLAVRLVQAVVGALTCVGLVRLGTRLFSPRVGVVAGLMLACYPPHAYFGWRLMGETLFAALVVFAVLLSVELLAAPRVLPSLLLGVTLGAAQLVKSNLAPLAPLLMLWFLFAARASRRLRVVCFAAMAAGAALSSTVTPIANSLTPGGRAVVLPGNTGRTFWFANNPVADGYWIRGEITPEGRAFIDSHGMTERLAQADDLEKDKILGRLAVAWIRENPGRFLRLCVKKLDNAFGLFPHALSLEGSRFASAVQAVSYGIVAVFGLAGLVMALPRFREVAPAYLALLSYLIMVIAFYGTPRFTIMVIPFLIVFASVSVVAAGERLLGPRAAAPART